MGMVTKKTPVWEFKNIIMTILSILMIIPLPVHIFPFVMLYQGYQAKVRKWYGLGWFFALAELVLCGSMIYFWGSLSVGTYITLAGFVASYLVGNGLLLSQIKPYLKRLELKSVHPLRWVNSMQHAEKLTLKEAEVETPESFVSKLFYYRKRINQPVIVNSIDQIIRLFQLLEKQDVLEAERFIVRHDTILQVLKEYDYVKNTQLRNEVTQQSLQKLQTVLSQATLAIEKDVTGLIQMRLLDVSVESDVYLQSLKNKNLLNDN